MKKSAGKPLILAIEQDLCHIDLRQIAKMFLDPAFLFLIAIHQTVPYSGTVLPFDLYAPPHSQKFQQNRIIDFPDSSSKL